MEQIVALLGRADRPTDGVADYCEFLGHALSKRGVDLKIVRVPAIEQGWLRALVGLRRISWEWRGRWVLLQYTALAWSRRGFPFGAVAIIILLRAQGTNCGVIFHEPCRQGEQSLNWIRRFRGACQDWVIRVLHRFSVRSVFTLPLNRIPWLSENDAKSAFIPLGANLPHFAGPPVRTNDHTGAGATVAVFCVSEPPFRAKEIGEISHAMRCAARIKSGLRIVFFGKGTCEAQSDITCAFNGMPVEVINRGLCELSEVRRLLADSDAMLCVRGQLDLRRGSALVGIAVGIPILAYSGASEGTPLMDAGIEFVPYGDREALSQALIRVLTDHEHWLALRERNLSVHKRYFSWDLIAREFVQALGDGPAPE